MTGAWAVTIRTSYRGFDTFVAGCGDGSVIVSGDDSLSAEDNHRRAAEELARVMGVAIVGGCERDNVGRRVWQARPVGA